jgi:hypothetical protein
MNEVLGVLAFALLFAVFGVLRSRSDQGGCGQCHGTCSGVCESADDSRVGPAPKGGRA